MNCVKDIFCGHSGRHGRFIAFAIVFLSFCAIFSYMWVDRRIAEENERLLLVLRTRGETAVWAAENAISLLDRENRGKISLLLQQLALQPGIAWLAIVDESGKILADSDPDLAGKFLYTAQEMVKLSPDASVQGRFSPDEPDVYEVWKAFYLKQGKGRRQKGNGEARLAIFAAMDASFLETYLEGYARELYNRVFVIAILAVSAIAIMYLARQFIKSGKYLRNTRAIALQVMGNFPEGILVCDMRGKILFCNRNLLDYLRLDGKHPECLDELPGLNWADFRREIISSGNPMARDGNIDKGEDGQVSVTGSIIRTENGQAAGLLFIVRDKTMILKMREKQLEESKFASLGKLASGIAHEIRNPLGAMCGYAALLSEKTAPESPEYRIAHLLLEEGQRLNEVLSELLSLVRKPELDPAPVTCGEIFAKILLLAEPDAALAGVKIILVYGSPALPQEKFMLDRDKILQALLNIVLNAVSFSPPGGRVMISANLDETSGARRLLISVADQGPGISPENLGQLFNPYFTTRPGGTGLGLTMAKNILESHKGEITVENMKAGGAKFTLVLPVK